MLDLNQRSLIPLGIIVLRLADHLLMATLLWSVICPGICRGPSRIVNGRQVMSWVPAADLEEVSTFHDLLAD